MAGRQDRRQGCASAATSLIAAVPRAAAGRHDITDDMASKNLVNDETLGPSRADIDLTVRAVLREVLALDDQTVAAFEQDSGLFGHLPELDSMAVAGLLTELEDRLDIVIDDEDVDGEMLETYGALLAFCEAKVATQ